MTIARPGWTHARARALAAAVVRRVAATAARDAHVHVEGTRHIRVTVSSAGDRDERIADDVAAIMRATVRDRRGSGS